MPDDAQVRSLSPPTTEGPLLAWLVEALRPMPRTRVKQLLRHGWVTVNGGTTMQFDHPLRPGDRVAIARNRPNPTDSLSIAPGVAIVAMDDALIAIDKPAGLLSVATDTEKADTAFASLRTWLHVRGQGRPFVVHRLDRDTSGLMLFARSAAVRDRLQSVWPRVTKTYIAVVHRMPHPAEGVIENYLTEGRDLRVRVTGPGGDAKRAVTRYRVLSSRGEFTRIEVGLDTGRKHQIRVHLAGLGCPIIGDTVYGSGIDPVGRLGLHAWRLALDHPETGKRLELESPLPFALQRVVG
jgi:23S rRNA pseudouridine1911/1915/1917 synthase